jgi:drug/metabolite transporter (DMT)-like permease
MVLWGIAWPVGRWLATGLPTISIAVIRYAVVVPVFLLILWLREHSFNLPKNWIPTLVFLGILNTTLYQAFFFLIAIMASLIINEPLTRLKIAGLLSGLAGVGLIASLSPNLNVSNRILGISLVFGGALSYAIYTVFLRKFINQHPTTAEKIRPSSLALITWISLFGWFFLIPFSILEHPLDI